MMYRAPQPGYSHVGFSSSAQSSFAKSTFPPHSTTATLSQPSSTRFPSGDRTAATPTPEEGSMTNFIRSHTSLVAAMMSVSLTHTTSSTRSRMMGHVFSPIDTLTPSATVSGGDSFIKRTPSRFDLAQSSAAMGSAAITLIFGLMCFAHTAMPPTMPPPPTGATIASRSLTCSSSSIAIVPCPAITSGSWFGCISTPPSFSKTSAAAKSRACSVGSHSTTSAPYPRTAAFFTAGEVLGMTTVAGTPRT
mmetsp:Transcript_34139/g.66481  ORF Transcript_34139/g.66481 Transcript_34139/m.66481 type:complete len:248 (+) Transcript_34139:197-940(+)